MVLNSNLQNDHFTGVPRVSCSFFFFLCFGVTITLLYAGKISISPAHISPGASSFLLPRSPPASTISGPSMHAREFTSVLIPQGDNTAAVCTPRSQSMLHAKWTHKGESMVDKSYVCSICMCVCKTKMPWRTRCAFQQLEGVHLHMLDTMLRHANWTFLSIASLLDSRGMRTGPVFVLVALCCFIDSARTRLWLQQ